MLNQFWVCMIVCIGIVICAGCTVTMSQTPPAVQLDQPLKPSKQMIDLSKISIGMSVDQVKAVMGDEVTVGFTITKEGQVSPITIKSLQKEEALKVHGFAYQVLYYFTYIVHPDDQITDDEMTPLVFENGILIAKSWSDLNKIKSIPISNGKF